MATLSTTLCSEQVKYTARNSGESCQGQQPTTQQRTSCVSAIQHHCTTLQVLAGQVVIMTAREEHNQAVQQSWTAGLNAFKKDSSRDICRTCWREQKTDFTKKMRVKMLVMGDCVLFDTALPLIVSLMERKLTHVDTYTASFI